MALHFLSALFAAAAGAAACQQDGPTTVRPLVEVRARLDTTLTPVADTYVRQDQPNTPQGGALFLQVSPPNSRGRALLRFDTAAVRQYVGAGMLESARVELTINLADNGWGPTGRTVNLHRLTQTWTEGEATWSCAIDADPTNQTHDCSGPTAWQMGSATSPPWEATPTASTVITNGQTGVVSFSVTADVAAILAGTQTHYGWIVRKAPEDSSGGVRFESREGVVPPRLVLAVQDTSRPALPATTFFYPQDTAFGVSPSEDSRIRYYRTVIGILFDDSTSGTTVRAVLARYSATVIGALRNVGAYVVRVPDPGPNLPALESLIAAITSEPGVAFAFALTTRDVIEPQGRYPSDDAAVAPRNAWLEGTGTAATRAWRAVRAPLAWGCETGSYGGSLVKVGVLDYFFDTTLYDLRRSLVQLVPPDSVQLDTAPSNLRTPMARGHGSAVAGVLTAEGDNDSGVAGVMWRSQLHLYPLGRSDSIVTDPAAYVAEVLLTAARNSGVRVLVSSVYLVSTQAQVNRDSLIRRELKRYLDAGQGNLFVQAAGNDDRILSSGDFLALRGSNLALAQAAVSLATTSNPDNVLIVAGTGESNARWSQPGVEGSNFIIGATAIAAPAANIVSLGNRQDFPAGLTQPDSGTSFAAPFVGGVAGLLWSLEPSLRPFEVKGYIQRGATELRLNVTTGTYEPPQPASGFDGSIYQLDAYGSLALLSRERVGTPICGYQVRAGDDGLSIVLEPSTGARPPMPVPGAGAPDQTQIGSISVAQGGRLIAVFIDAFTNLDTVPRTIVINHLGQAVGSPLAFKRRRFLERDTVDAELPDWPSPASYSFTIRPGDGSAPRTVNPVGAAAGLTPDFNFGYGDIGPAGDYAAVVTVGSVGDPICEGADLKRMWLVPIDGMPIFLADERYPSCGGAFGLELTNESLGWSHDGRRAVFVTFKADNSGTFQTKVTSAATGGVSVSPVVQGLWVQTPRFTADDSLLITGQSNLSAVCEVQFRVPSSPATTVGSPSPGRDLVDCFGVYTPAVPNTPPAYTARASAAAFARRISHRWSAFNLTAGERQLRRWAWPRHHARAQVN
jgi:hypothetical protein